MIKKTALYLRLSRDDERGGESESIKNQREFLTRYAESLGLLPTVEFADDGFSGTSFDRPAFLAMTESIKAGEIGAVIVKDLSRLGRDYIKTGYYIEEFFPLNGVRFIAVNDMIDTNDRGLEDDLLPFKSVMNDMYAKDISKKVRTALITKKLSGKFIGSSAPYGYKKDAQNPGRLIVDDCVSGVVRRIYGEFLAGKSIKDITSGLNVDGIFPPSKYKGDKRAGDGWNAATVRNILKNPTYAGNLAQNRARRISYKIKKKVSLPEDEWIVVEKTHDAIIAEADFSAVSQRFSEREHRLSGHVFCKDCGARMSFMRSGRYSYLVCGSWRCDTKSCSSHCIREDYLEKICGEGKRIFVAKDKSVEME